MNGNVRIALGIVAMTLAGCSGGGGSNSYGNPICNIESPYPAMVSPSAGAVNVSTSIGTLSFANLSFGETIVLLPQGGSPITLGAFTISAPDETVAVQTLAPKTTYTVEVEGVPATGCNSAASGTSTITIGTFTTQ